MRRRLQRGRFTLVAVVLLATYGPAGILGYGLHSLWHCDHCACEQLSVQAVFDRCGFDRCEFDHCGLEHCHGHKGTDCTRVSESPTKEKGPRPQASTDCLICDFLAQAQVHFAFEFELGMVDVLATNPPRSPIFYGISEFGTPPGRGPPCC